MAVGDASITALLHAWAQGDRDALDRLTPLVYGELHHLAGAYLRRERSDHTLSPTALISEAFLRLVVGEHPAYEHRVQFFAVAARHMRRILIDHARGRTAGKRGGRDRPVTFDEALVATADRPEELVALDDALEALASVDERKARAVELRYFGGMSHKEIADALAVHENTVARDLRLAQAWLHRHMMEAADRDAGTS
ncbi:MAG TPA: sigma-70 family RNA polymerase sigma factor [Kofleriaceae bacterium]|nr:sigma-70 family RNA polymerase sigma factor [Kofleriaceae bacterium]